MRQITKSFFFSGTLALGLSLTSSTIATASSHLDAVSLRPHAPEIDMVITGANADTRRLRNLPANGKTNSKCPLCFHRNLMKSQQGNKLLKSTQPFPGD